jgi:lipoate-protein ligase A
MTKGIILNKEEFRLILSDKSSAKINMATDEALALSYSKNDTPIFRLYSWEKSFTLGISQKISDYEYLKEYNHNYAKRMTGGGVLFHGHDLSYSLILPVTYLEDMNVKESYEKICSFLLEFYKSVGLNAIYVKDDEKLQLSKSQFCQVGFEAYDIVIDGIKIGGNAQRRTKNFIFQHGSIPIEKRDSRIQEQSEIGHGLNDFNINLSYEEVKKLVMQAFEKTFEITLRKSLLYNKEEEKLSLLLKDKI